MCVSEDVCKTVFLHSSNIMLPGLDCVAVLVHVVEIVELGEDAYVSVSYGHNMLVCFKDFVVKDLLKEGGIFSLFLWTKEP